MIENRLIITLDNGISLYVNGQTDLLNKYALEKGLTNVRCFLSIDAKQYKEFVLFSGQQPVFASQKVEDVAVHIDILSLGEH